MYIVDYYYSIPYHSFLSPNHMTDCLQKNKLLQVVLLNVYDVMIKAVMVVPRVETKLYSEWVSNWNNYLIMAYCQDGNVQV